MATWRRLLIGVAIALGVFFGTLGAIYLLSTRYPEALVAVLLAVVFVTTALVVRQLRGRAGNRSSRWR